MVCKSITKNGVFYLNVVYGLAGLLVEGIGFALLVKWIATHQQDSIGLSWLYFILAGMLMIIIAVIGCYGALRERNGILIAYAIFILTVFVLQVVLAVLLTLYSCIVGAVFEQIIETIVRGDNSTNVHHKTEPKDCNHYSPLEVLTGIVAYFLCSAFSDGPCNAKQGSMYERWYIPTNIVTISVPLIEILGGCLALFLAVQLIMEMKPVAVPETTENLIPPESNDNAIPAAAKASSADRVEVSSFSVQKTIPC